MAKLDFENQPSSNESGILAALWRKVIKEGGFISSLNTFIELYLRKNDVTEGRVAVVKKKTKSTLINNITASEMTVKTFMDLIFGLLNAKKIKLTVEITYQNDKTSSHSVTALPANTLNKEEKDEARKDN